jgi:CDP-6-deoxy-D-xylo-4-hexulose-3-dehydrase
MENLESKKWKPGDWTYINKLQWGQPELDKITEALDSDWFAGNSKFNTNFEKKVSEFSGLKYVQTMNSGSAALEIAVQTLVQKKIWRRGDKILHPALTFPTSIASAIMAGLVPVFVDVDEGTYVISDDGMEKAFEIHPDIKGAVIPALLGNAPNIDKLKTLLDNKPLIIDSCDVMGTKWDGREIGSYGDFAAYSFYGSHHISTFGVGGALATDNPEYSVAMKSMCFWGRDFSADGLDPIQNFLRRYSYSYIGLDAQMSAVQAAFGLAQFDRLPEYLGERNAVFNRLHNLFLRYQDYFILPMRTDIKADINWFCFPITLRQGTPFTREFFVKYLLDNKIEIRPIMAGNLTNHLPYAMIKSEIVGSLHNSDVVSRRGFFIPGCPMPSDQLENYITVLEGFLKKY